MTSSLALEFMTHHNSESRAVAYHNERLGGDAVTEHKNEHIDPMRTDDNINLLPHDGPGKYPEKTHYKRIVAIRDAYTSDTKFRKNGITFVEATVQFGGDFEGKPDSYYVSACKYAFNWIEDTFGKESIVSAMIHMDEVHPHLHVDFVPIRPDTRKISWEYFSHGKAAMWALRNSCIKYMNERMPEADFQTRSQEDALKQRRFHSGKNQKDFEALANGWKEIDKRNKQLDAMFDQLDSLSAGLLELQKQLEEKEKEKELIKLKAELDKDRAEFENMKANTSNNTSSDSAQDLVNKINIDELLKSCDNNQSL